MSSSGSDEDDLFRPKPPPLPGAPMQSPGPPHQTLSAPKQSPTSSEVLGSRTDVGNVRAMPSPLETESSNSKKLLTGLSKNDQAAQKSIFSSDTDEDDLFGRKPPPLLNG